MHRQKYNSYLMLQCQFNSILTLVFSKEHGNLESKQWKRIEEALGTLFFCSFAVPMSVKVYIHLEEPGFAEKTSKIQVPKSWSEKTVKDVIGLFVNAYNAKSENKVDLEAVHFAKSDGTKLYSDDTVSATLEDLCDYYIKMGVHNRPAAVVSEAETFEFRCKNYGCNKYYNEVDNTDDACVCHTAPPIFHDTMKCWSCCKDKKAYDFESFQLIVGCHTCRHSNVAKAVSIAASPNATTNVFTSVPAEAPKSIASFNQANPNAASAVASAIVSTTRKSSRNADGTTAKCQRKGCQKQFVLAENSNTSCTYHKGQPVFHDAIKIWSCCPEKKCYDFDEFLAVPGCAVGCHDDGEIELSDA